MIQIMKDEFVLILGYRKALIQEAINLQLKIILWTDQNIGQKTESQLGHIHIEDFPKNQVFKKEKYSKLLDKLSHFHITYVISCVERTVYLGSQLRRILDARKSKNSVLIKCIDKLEMKEEAKKLGIKCANFFPVRKSSTPDKILEVLSLPVVIKDRRSSGSRGLKVCHHVEDLKSSMRENAIAEEFISGREVSIESFVQHNQILFTNITEYVEKKHVNFVPAYNLSEKLDLAISNFNSDVIKKLKISWGITHLEVYIKEDNELVFGEIAIRPPGGYIMDLITLAYGFNSWEAFLKIELDMPFEFPTDQHEYAFAMILHPGGGIVEKIQGYETLIQDSSIIKHKLKIAEGDSIEERVGVGEEVGHIIGKNADPEYLFSLLDKINKDLKITLKQ
jgi:hypothetical protein